MVVADNFFLGNDTLIVALLDTPFHLGVINGNDTYEGTLGSVSKSIDRSATSTVIVGCRVCMHANGTLLLVHG